MSLESAMAVATGQPIPQSPGLAQADVPATPEVPKELESSRFAHLAKQEAALVKQREEFKKERDLINSEKEKLKPIQEKLLKFEELKKKDPLAAIKMLEFSDTDFINYMASLEDTSTPEDKARKAAQEEINKFTSEQKKKEDELRNSTNNRIINEFKSSISNVFSSDKEKFELSNRMGKTAEDMAFDFVAECVKIGMEPPTAEEAASMTEEYYENYFKEIMTSKKLTPKEAAQAAKEAVSDAPLKAEVSPRPSQPSKTLSSKTTVTTASTVTRRETPSEKRERLMRKLANGG